MDHNYHNPTFSFLWNLGGTPTPHVRRTVLSMDGGGVRGVIAACVLNRIERMTGEPTHKLFDLVGGTSIGGILALALTTPDAGGFNAKYSAADLIGLFTERRDELFVPAAGAAGGGGESAPSGDTDMTRQDEPLPAKYADPLPMFREYFRDCYAYESLTDILVTYATDTAVIASVSNRSIHTAVKVLDRVSVDLPFLRGFQQGLAELTGAFSTVDVCITNAVTRTGIVTFSDVRAMGSRVKLRSAVDTEGLECATIARMTSAAPTYFPLLRMSELPALLGDSGYVLDGGLACNRPENLCLNEVRAIHGVREDEVFILSIATGSGMQKPRDGESVLATIASAAVDASMERDQHIADLDTRANGACVVRFAVEFPAYQVDLDGPVEDVERLRADVEAFLDTEDARKHLEHICNVLMLRLYAKESEPAADCDMGMRRAGYEFDVEFELGVDAA